MKCRYCGSTEHISAACPKQRAAPGPSSSPSKAQGGLEVRRAAPRKPKPPLSANKAPPPPAKPPAPPVHKPPPPLVDIDTLARDVTAAKDEAERVRLLRDALAKARAHSKDHLHAINDVVRGLALVHKIDPAKLHGRAGALATASAAITPLRADLIAAYRRDVIESHAWGGWMEAEAAAKALGIRAEVYTGANQLVTTLNPTGAAPAANHALYYTGNHYVVVNTQTLVRTDHGAGGDCLYLALLALGGLGPGDLAWLRRNTARRLTDEQIFLAISLLEFDSNAEQALGPNFRRLLGVARLTQGAGRGRRAFETKEKGVDVMAPFVSRQKLRPNTKSVTVVAPSGDQAFWLNASEISALVIRMDGKYDVPAELVRHDEDPDWTSLSTSHAEPCARYGVEIQLNNVAVDDLTFFAALDVDENGYKPIWRSKLRVREGMNERWRPAFMIATDTNGFSAVLEIATTYVSGTNLDAFYRLVGPEINAALRDFGLKNPAVERTGAFSPYTYLLFENAIKGATLVKSVGMTKLGQATTTLTAAELGLDDEGVRTRIRSQFNEFKSSKTRDRLFKNSIEQLTVRGAGWSAGALAIPLAGGTRLHKGSFHGGKKVMTFGGNKLGLLFHRPSGERAYLVEHREGTELGRRLAVTLVDAIRGTMRAGAARALLAELKFPIESAGVLGQDRLE